MVRSFPLNAKKLASLKSTKNGRRWITFIITFSDFCLQFYLLPLTVFSLENHHYRPRSSRNNPKLLLKIQIYRKQSTRSRVKQSMFMLLYALFISFRQRNRYFPVWWASSHWQLISTYRDLENFVQQTQQIRFYLHVNQSFRREQPISQIKRTIRARFSIFFSIARL